MSRSRRETPIAGVTGNASNKYDKGKAHRRERTAIKALLRRHQDDTSLPPPQAFSDPWGWVIEGKMRFDPAEFPKLMRK
jgi:hypothetical protein